MGKVFLVCGYGVPKNILKDENYNFYLKKVFNMVYDAAAKDGVTPIIVCSGGVTDMRKPYKRTEADEMIRLLKALAKRPSVKKVTTGWRFVAERKAISTLENLLFLKDIVKKMGFDTMDITIFCEYTRTKRVHTLARKIFQRAKVVPVDFDVSSNRYLDPAFIAKREKEQLKHSLWALCDNRNLKAHHEFFKKKIEVLRHAGSRPHTEVLREWWKNGMKELY